MKKLFLLLLVLGIFFLGGMAGFFARPKIQPLPTQTVNKDIYLAFTVEVWDKIKENYWDKVTDELLANLFVAATEKLAGQPQVLKTKNKEAVEKMVASVLRQIPSPDKKKEYVTQMADLVLTNLQPFGRSRVYSRKEETALKNNVQNINPEIDQYQVLDIPKQASSAAIKKNYEEKVAELKPQATKSPEAREKLAQIEKAYQVLGDEANRKVYDLSGVEPTMNYKLIRPDIFYTHIYKFSPTTLDELQRVAEKTNDKPEANILILDLRGNIGGAFDGLPWFLGPFIGIDQYAYQLFHQGEKTDYKTRAGWLPGLFKFKKVVILIDNNTQSTAEVMASVLKKYNVGVLVGTTTKGWGTIEKVFEINQQLDKDENYSLFLVHSVSLREDGQPIEGHGVEPMINLQGADWEKELYSYFHYEEIAKAIKEILAQK